MCSVGSDNRSHQQHLQHRSRQINKPRSRVRSRLRRVRVEASLLSGDQWMNNARLPATQRLRKSKCERNRSVRITSVAQRSHSVSHLDAKPSGLTWSCASAVLAACEAESCLGTGAAGSTSSSRSAPPSPRSSLYLPLSPSSRPLCSFFPITCCFFTICLFSLPLRPPPQHKQCVCGGALRRSAVDGEMCSDTLLCVCVTDK